MNKTSEQRADPTHLDVAKSCGTNRSPTVSTKRHEPPSFTRLIGTGISLLLVIGIAAAATRKDAFSPSAETDAEAAKQSPLEVRTLVVGQVEPPAQTRTYSGTLAARFESELSFERAGRVEMIGPHEGTFVMQGDVLARLAQDDLDAKQHRIESELAAAEAVLSELVAGPRKQTIQAAAARVSELEARVLLAESDAKRQSKLAPQGATSQSQLDSASFGFQASRQSLLAAKATLQELQEGTRAEQITAQRAKCDAIRGSLREIEADRADSQIVAPFAGAIQARMVDAGVVVSPGSPALNLVSHSIEARVALPPTVAQSLHPGSKVSLRCNDELRDGWVDRIAPSIMRETRTRDIYLRFINDQSNDQAETFVKMARRGWIVGEIVELILNRRLEMGGSDARDANKYWLPINSLSRGARGLWTVLAVPGPDAVATCERRSVELLKTDGSYALVQGMLREGERVISDGIHRVTAGMLVQSSPQKSTDFALDAVQAGGETAVGQPFHSEASAIHSDASTIHSDAADLSNDEGAPIR